MLQLITENGQWHLLFSPPSVFSWSHTFVFCPCLPYWLAIEQPTLLSTGQGCNASPQTVFLFLRGKILCKFRIIDDSRLVCISALMISLDCFSLGIEFRGLGGPLSLSFFMLSTKIGHCLIRYIRNLNFSSDIQHWLILFILFPKMGTVIATVQDCWVRYYKRHTAWW